MSEGAYIRCYHGNSRRDHSGRGGQGAAEEVASGGWACSSEETGVVPEPFQVCEQPDPDGKTWLPKDTFSTRLIFIMHDFTTAHTGFLGHLASRILIKVKFTCSTGGRSGAHRLLS